MATRRGRRTALGSVVGAAILLAAGAAPTARAQEAPAAPDVRSELTQLVQADVRKAAPHAPPKAAPAAVPGAGQPQSEGDVVEMDPYIVKNVQPARTQLLPDETPLLHFFRTGHVFRHRGDKVTALVTFSIVPISPDALAPPGSRDYGRVELSAGLRW